MHAGLSVSQQKTFTAAPPLQVGPSAVRGRVTGGSQDVRPRSSGHTTPLRCVLAPPADTDLTGTLPAQLYNAAKSGKPDAELIGLLERSANINWQNSVNARISL